MKKTYLFILLCLVLLLGGCGSEAVDPTPPAVEVEATVAISLPIQSNDGEDGPAAPDATATAVPPPSPVEAAYPAAEVVEVAPATAVPQAYPAPGAETAVSQYTYRIVNVYPHDPTAFTQGLLWTDGVLYESTGDVVSAPSLRQVQLADGEVLQIHTLPNEFFAEGLVLWGDKLIQLTWKNNVAFVYDKDSFEQLAQFSYPTQGWGITHDGQRLIMSDGSATLFFRDPETFAEIGRINVSDRQGPVNRLNELEYINGEVWANVWQTERVARIDPGSGQVVGWIDFSGLLAGIEISQRVDVLNGIAYDAENDRIFVTGKLWPALFEVEIVAVTPVAE